jgi:hypothetical protein
MTSEQTKPRVEKVSVKVGKDTDAENEVVGDMCIDVKPLADKVCV